LWRGILVLLGVVLLGVGWLGYLRYVADRDLHEALAEADRLDPGWRLADLEAARAAVPDAENGGLQVQAAAALLPLPWHPGPGKGNKDLESQVARLPARVLFGESLSGNLREQLRKVDPARTVAHRLADMPRGRYTVPWSNDGIGTLMPHIEPILSVCRLLRLDAALKAHDGDVDGALASCRGMLNTGRSLGDEPTALSQHVRRSCQILAVKALERTLAQGEASDPALEAVQRLLEEEEKEPLQLIAARG
jgi:hypothetical protein